MFEDLIDNVEREVVKYILRGRIQTKTDIDNKVNKLKSEHQKSETLRKDTVVKQTEEKVGRNDPCPCGSGKKYKSCCGV